MCKEEDPGRDTGGRDLALGFRIDGTELVEESRQLIGLHFLSPRLEPPNRRRGGPDLRRVCESRLAFYWVTTGIDAEP